eukprot:1003142-Alexandrium_andersonii.AAC.1
MSCVIHATSMREGPGRFCENMCVTNLRSQFARLRLRLLARLSLRSGPLLSTIWRSEALPRKS